MDIQLTQEQGWTFDTSKVFLMTHAMVLTGVDLDEMASQLSGRLKNSWGDKVGADGYLSLETLGWTKTLTKSLSVKRL